MKLITREFDNTEIYKYIFLINNIHFYIKDHNVFNSNYFKDSFIKNKYEDKRYTKIQIKKLSL